MSCGNLVADVHLEGIDRFVLETPFFALDSGTARFGVAISKVGVSEVGVFEGVCSVSGTGSREVIRVSKGGGCRVMPNQRVIKIDYIPGMPARSFAEFNAVVKNRGIEKKDLPKREKRQRKDYLEEWEKMPVDGKKHLMSKMHKFW